MNWIHDRWHNLTDLGSATWLAIAAWAAVALGVAALIYANRQVKRNRQLVAEQIQPHVVMYMEPNAADWHLIELVVRNFGRTPAHNIGFTFFKRPTVARYEEDYDDERPDVEELQLPRELPILAPGQEWRTVWDSAMDRNALGDAIESRFVGAVIYYDRPPVESRWSIIGLARKRREFQTKVVLDWDDLQPVERLELMTTHDRAKREKHKLQLLRSVLTYYNYAKETEPEVLRTEIERMNRAAEHAQDRLRTRRVAEQAQDGLRTRRVGEPPDPETTRLELPWANGEPALGRHRHVPEHPNGG